MQAQPNGFVSLVNFRILWDRMVWKRFKRYGVPLCPRFAAISHAVYGVVGKQELILKGVSTSFPRRDSLVAVYSFQPIVNGSPTMMILLFFDVRDDPLEISRAE